MVNGKRKTVEIVQIVEIVSCPLSSLARRSFSEGGCPLPSVYLHALCPMPYASFRLASLAFLASLAGSRSELPCALSLQPYASYLSLVRPPTHDREFETLILGGKSIGRLVKVERGEKGEGRREICFIIAPATPP